MEEENQEEDVEQVIPQSNLSTIDWDKQQAAKLINIVTKTLDIDQYPIFLPNLKQPITFYEFEESYKKDISFGNSVVPSPDDDFLRIIDEIKMSLRTIVKERLLDAIRKQLEIIKSLELQSQQLKIQNNNLSAEVEKMSQEIKDNTELKQKNEELETFAKNIIKDVESEFNFFKENIERKISKRKLEVGIEEEAQESSRPNLFSGGKK